MRQLDRHGACPPIGGIKLCAMNIQSSDQSATRVRPECI